jgi:hypothetical protein
MKFNQKLFSVKLSAILFPKEAKIKVSDELDIKALTIDVSSYNDIAEDGIYFD